MLDNLLKYCSLFLVGMMGCGKSTVGRSLAKKLNYRFFDTDSLIEAVTQEAIADIFAEQGEGAFRDLETQVLGQLSAQIRSVIATGGGIILKPENWGYLHHGIVIWLDVPVEVLYHRLKADQTRPLLKTSHLLETLQELRDRRQSYYAQADLHLALSGTESPEQVADQVVRELPRILKPKQPPESVQN